MALLVRLLFFVFIGFMIMSVIVSVGTLIARDKFGNLKLFNRLLALTPGMCYAACVVGIAFTILGFCSGEWVTPGGPKILIVLAVALSVVDWIHTIPKRSDSTHIKNEKARRKFYDAAKQDVLTHKRNERGYLSNVGVCPICYNNSIGVEPYRYSCPYCGFTVEITDDDVIGPG